MINEQIKILLLGEYGVGKSSIIRNYFKKDFVNDYNPTFEELHKKSVKVKDKTYDLVIYDILGIDDFNNKIDNMIRECQCFMIIFSITRLTSFEKVKKIKNRIFTIKKMDKVREYPLVLIGNKYDLEEERQISQIFIQNQILNFDIKFYQVSAKNGNNIEKAFKKLIKQHIKIKEHLRASFKEKQQETGPFCC